MGGVFGNSFTMHCAQRKWENPTCQASLSKQSPLAFLVQDAESLFSRMAASPCPPLRWGPHYLEHFASALLRRVPKDLECSLMSQLTSRTWSWASGCSGSESPHFVFSSLHACLLREQSTCAPFEQIFSAEVDAAKRNWIRSRCFTGQTIFDDIFDVSKTTNVQSRRLGLFIAGFSCKTVSALANNSVRHHAISSLDGTTGETFHGVLLVLQRWKPACVILENVHGLSANDQHLAVRDRVEACGYVVMFWLNNAAALGFPQSRKRFWFVGWRRELVGDDVEEFKQRLEDIVQRFTTDWDMLKVSDFLLDDGHPALDISSNVDNGRRSRAPASAGSKKRKVPMSWRSNWQEHLSELYPHYLQLPERCRNLLDTTGCAFPEPKHLCIRLDQSFPDVHAGILPTVTPKGLLWLAHKVRPMHGLEKMAAQGMYIDPAESAESTWSWSNSFFSEFGGQRLLHRTVHVLRGRRASWFRKACACDVLSFGPCGMAHFRSWFA